MNSLSVGYPAIDSVATPAATPAYASARRLLLPAAAQLLPNATACSLGVTEGKHRLGLFLLVSVLIGTIIPTEIAVNSEMFVSRTIFGIPPHYALTAFTFALAFLFDLRFYQRVITRPLVALSLILVAYVFAIGVVRHGMGSYLVRSDIYIIRWVFVGFILTRLAMISGMLRPYLIVTTLVILLVALAIDAKNTEAGQIDTSIKRAVSSNLWPVVNYGMIMIGLLVTVCWPRSWAHAAFSLTAFGLLVFAGAIRTSTRSVFAVDALCLLLMLVALARDPRMRGRGQGLRRVGAFATLVGAAVFIYQIVGGGAFSSQSQLAGRFSEAFTSNRLAASRVDEATHMLGELTVDEWVLGQGLGGMFYSSLGAWTNVPHIAVLGWLQKGGLFIFAIVIMSVYVSPAIALFRQLLLPQSASPLPPPILVVGPMLVSWCALTFISGGIDIGSFLGLGSLAALWIQLADDEKTFLADRRATSRKAGPQIVHAQRPAARFA